MEENTKTKTKTGTKERKKNWQETYATVEDIKDFLDKHVVLRHNVITGRAECHVLADDPWEEYDGSTESAMRMLAKSLSPKPSPIRDGNSWQPLTDRIVNSVWTKMSRQKAVRVQDLFRVIESDFVPEYDPFRFYLDNLPPWNGRDDYLLELSASVLVRGDVEEQLLFASYLKKWLVGMVAAWVDDTVVNNVILVLIGPQGSYKTTWFHYLLPPPLRQYFYTKTNANRMGRDDLLTLARYGLVCCEELDTMRPAELNQLKAAVTMPAIDERAAYARYHEHRRHIASFCGTGNNMQFLSDPTGNRRWLPFEVDTILSPRDNPLNYDGIYSQAYRLYREGFQYWFTQPEIMRLARHNRQFETPRLEQELVAQYFRIPRQGEPGEFISVALALQIVGANITQKLSTVMLGRAFMEQGFQKKTYQRTRGYIVVRRSLEEMRSMRQLAACVDDRNVTDDTDDTGVF